MQREDIGPMTLGPKTLQKEIHNRCRKAQSCLCVVYILSKGAFRTGVHHKELKA